ncbi:MAG: alpha/beta hydrolase [Pseudomonadota bacterium]
MSGPNYAELIDQETWAYIAKLDAAYPPDAVTLTVAQQRDLYDTMCRIFHRPRPARVSVKDVSYGGVACREYSASETAVTVIYYHGGGFVVGSLDSHDNVCAEICDLTGYRVISVAYALAPEVVFPGCFNDAWAACAAICSQHNGRVILCGDSAGGNLAAAIAHHSRAHLGDTRIAGQVLIYPGLGGDMTKGSYVRHAHAPQLTLADLEFYQRVRFGGRDIPRDDPRCAPLRDSDFARLPPTVVITAECDPLSSDGESYRDALLRAGGKAVWIEVAGMVHACLRARHSARRAAAFFGHVVDGIAALGKGAWPYGENQVLNKSTRERLRP